MVIALFRLPCLQVTLSAADIEATTIRDFLSPQVTASLSPRFVLTRITGFATAILILPREQGQYTLGASKQTLRRKVRHAQKLGVRWAEVSDLQERQRLIELAEEYEKVHPDETYRNAEADLSWLLSHQLWLAAYSADGNPLLLSVTPVDGELALLGHFRTIGFGEEQSDARYLMTEVLVRHPWLTAGCAISSMREAWRYQMGFGISSECWASISFAFVSRGPGRARLRAQQQPALAPAPEQARPSRYALGARRMPHPDQYGYDP